MKSFVQQMLEYTHGRIVKINRNRQKELKKLNRTAMTFLGRKLEAIDIPKELPEGWYGEDLCYFVALHVYVDKILIRKDRGINFIKNIKVPYEEVKYIHFFANSGYSDNASDEVHLKAAAGMCYPPVLGDRPDIEELIKNIRSMDNEIQRDIQHLCNFAFTYKAKDNGLIIREKDIDFSDLTDNYNNMFKEPQKTYTYSELCNDTSLGYALTSGQITQDDFEYLARETEVSLCVYPYRYGPADDSNWTSIWLLLSYAKQDGYQQGEGTDELNHVFSIDIEKRELIIEPVDLYCVANSDTFTEETISESGSEEIQDIVSVITGVINA